MPGGSEGTRCVDTWKMSLQASWRCRKSRVDEVRVRGCNRRWGQGRDEIQDVRGLVDEKNELFHLKEPPCSDCPHLDMLCALAVLPSFHGKYRRESFIFMASSLKITWVSFRLSRPKSLGYVVSSGQECVSFLISFINLSKFLRILINLLLAKCWLYDQPC